MKHRARARIRAAATAACLPLVLGGSVYWLFVILPWGRGLDHVAFVGRLSAGRHLLGASRLLLDAISVPLVAVALAALIWWGRRFGRLREGLLSTAAVAGAAVSAEALKVLLPAATRDGSVVSLSGSGSFPSGHATIAAALALAFLAQSPAPGRSRWTGPAVAWTVVVAIATVTAGWHRPSDAVGGILLAVTWHRAVWAAAGARREGVRQLESPQVQHGRGALTRPGQASFQGPVGRWAVGWGPWRWWAVVAAAELTVLMLPSPAESAWEAAAVGHYLAVALVLLAGGASMVWAVTTVTSVPMRGTGRVSVRGEAEQEPASSWRSSPGGGPSAPGQRREQSLRR